jgi:sulfate adenylyltransferase
MSDAKSDPPSIVLSDAQLNALELIMTGLVAPIDGYRLPGAHDAGWPCDSTLIVASGVGAQSVEAGTVLLTDPDRTPLARLTVTGSRENSDGTYFLAGDVDALRSAEHGPARSLRLGRSDEFSESFVAVFSQVPGPPEVAAVVRAAGALPIVFLTAVGLVKMGQAETQSMIGVIRNCAAATDRASARVVAVAPLAEDVAPEFVLTLVLANAGAVRTQMVEASPAAEPGGHQLGTVVLLTGLSGSGKSTIGRALSERLVLAGERTVLLDGDDVRTNLSDDLSFSAIDRETNLRRIGWVASKIAAVGGIAICAPIAPFDSARRDIRRMAEAAGRFALVYVSTPLAVCEERDRKGLYARARAGEIADFTGINSPFEEPEDADVVIDTAHMSVDDAVDLILARAFAHDAR